MFSAKPLAHQPNAFRLPACTVAYNGPITKAERWLRFKPKFGDIIVCSPAKCGTTWMQAICGILVSGRHDADFAPAKLSPWIDADFVDLEAAIIRFERQVKRRYFKTHTPLDGIPYYPECTYVAIYRDPRDALISQQALAQIAGDGSAGAPADIRAWLKIWLEEPFRAGLVEQPTLAAFAHHALGFWQFRHLPNMHLFHYADLVGDPAAGIRAVADAIAQPVDDGAIRDIVRATAFAAMRMNAQRYAPSVGSDDSNIEGAFFRKAALGEWQDVFSANELSDYRGRIAALLPSDLVDWLETGSANSRAHTQIPRLANSDSPEVRQVEDAAGKQELERAIALARKHLDAGLEHPLFLNLSAYWHETSGRDVLSLIDLNRARLLAPKSPIILNSLGLAYARQHRPAEALEAFSYAVALDPQFLPAQFNKGWASEDAGELEAAKQAFETAAELSPHSAAPLARTAALATRMSDWPRARNAAERALTIEASQPVATVALAQVELAEGDARASELRIRSFLSRQAGSPADRAYALTVLADALHAQNRFDEAFAAYAERNAILHTLHAPRFSCPGVETMAQQAKWLRDYLDRLDPGRRGAFACEYSGEGVVRKHIFVLGFARSGTTLIEEMLAANSLVCATQEREAMADSVRAFMATPGTMARLDSLPDEGLMPYRQAYWRGIRSFGIEPANCFVVDKQPFNTIRLPLIARLFPSADVLFCQRDPRDVVLSCFRRQFAMTPATFELLSLEGTARFYDAAMTIAVLAQAKLPLRWRAVRHEDILRDCEGEMRRICAFIDMPWSDEMLRFSDRVGRRPVTTPSATQIAKGIDRQAFGQWRQYRNALAPVLEILRPWVERFGYPIE